MGGGDAEEKTATARTYEEQLASLYLDLAIADHHSTDRLMMGFDQPYNAFTDMKTATGQILDFPAFEGAQEAISSGNALRVLPGLAKRLGR